MKKILVAYFSAGGVTAGVAKRLAEAADADLFEIRPQVPYTRADLNWMNKKSRSTVEMQDRTCRPPMAETADLAAYDLIFLGFPIWWYREPSIIDTFMESGDFTGKTVVTFCTSDGSGLGDSAENLRVLAPGAQVKSGKRFSGRASKAELQAWVETVR
jgi:flavodoxin